MSGKRDRSLPKSYRPIALLSCLGKGLERLLARRLAHSALKLGILARDQCSAVPKRAATDLTTVQKAKSSLWRIRNIQHTLCNRWTLEFSLRCPGLTATNYRPIFTNHKVSVQSRSETSSSSFGQAGTKLCLPKISKVRGNQLAYGHGIRRLFSQNLMCISDERPSSSESSRSVLEADDWRNIERLVNKVSPDVSDPDTKKLRSTTHHLSTQIILLKLQNDGL